jgi:hypothetical protein
VVTLVPGNPGRDLPPAAYADEGAELQSQIQKWMSVQEIGPTYARPEGMDGRAREIWGVVFGLAQWLQADDQQMERIKKFAYDVEGAKDAPKRSAYDADAAAKVEADRWARRAVIDLLSVFRDGERNISTAQAIERMQGITEASWRTLKGVGLDEYMLSGYCRRFGFGPVKVRIKGNPKPLQGYKRDDVERAARIAAGEIGGVK